MTKVFYKSWTLWVNFLILVLSLFDAPFFALFDMSEKAIGIALGIILKVVAVGNIALRLFMSESKITGKQAIEQYGITEQLKTLFDYK